MSYNIENGFITEIKDIIQQAKKQVYNSVNTAMVVSYWLIGKRIVEEEQSGAERADYGKFIVQSLSETLTKEFGSGFSKRSLWEYRQFYTVFSADDMTRTMSALSVPNNTNNNEIQIVRTLFAQLSWSHIRLIMRLTNNKAKNYYIKEASENNWSVRTLDRNISTQYYERLLLSEHKEDVINEMLEKTQELQINKLDFIKNPTVLEFLNLPPNKGYTEKELEKAIIADLHHFLLELGKGYAFVAQQQLIRTAAKDYFLDLVFYNYILKCFVLIDLKTERISHQDVGQMDMYVRMYDEHKKNENDNPTIGIVLCSETDTDIAKYSILKGNEQLFATKYKLYLPTEEELRAEIEREKLNFKLQMAQKK
ncbi:PDDEXK nuclease domain-containing protein [Polaribacter litorisediminis]|uniref:PDDEXK nuclease domain-containing protein n=1 Tax=Polaribacter litorisediminis TaxID=1908341 RepID=UPI001CBBFFFE|nr:PDDEXK nuclease domain-containing protein [Polaribacter litorisediminis]UAM97445.1 PDDEXK nuclease domain-containing protein [Polaribacter litorisediminis]